MIGLLPSNKPRMVDSERWYHGDPTITLLVTLCVIMALRMDIVRMDPTPWWSSTTFTTSAGEICSTMERVSSSRSLRKPTLLVGRIGCTRVQNLDCVLMQRNHLELAQMVPWKRMSFGNAVVSSLRVTIIMYWTTFSSTKELGRALLQAAPCVFESTSLQGLWLRWTRKLWSGRMPQMLQTVAGVHGLYRVLWQRTW